MNQNKSEVCVVIPTNNRANDLKRCLESLSRQTFVDFETIVIDNGSTDETSSLLRKYSVRVIQDSTRNVTHLFNVGWKNSKAEIVVFLNDDAEAVPGWLEEICTTFKEVNDAGAVGGPTVLPVESKNNQEMLRLHENAKKQKLLRPFGRIYEDIILEGRYNEVGVLCQSGAYSVGGSLLESTKLGGPFSVDLLSITNAGIRRQVLEEINGLDENFKFTHGDGDLFIRIRNRGYKLIFNPRAMVWHHVNPSGDTRGAFWRGRDQAYFFKKDIKPSSFSGKLKLFLNMIFFNLYWPYKTIETKKISYLRGNLGFFRGLYDYYWNKINHRL
ncbi:MAG: glycosyltransferase [Candidatus Omnitrophica bacterium]|nr:glycosyltransferase [Candidatus Omnitrophota bacterium]